MKTVSYYDAKENLQAILDQATDGQEMTVIKRPGKPDAVIMSLQEYTSLKETLYLLGNPKNAAHLWKSLRQLERAEACD